MPNQDKRPETKAFHPKVNEVVKQMLQLHEGGKEFFENLDFAVRDPDIVQSLYDKIEEFTGVIQHIYVVSGKFGVFFKNWIECYGCDIDIVYAVNGGLRDGDPIDSLEPFKEDLNGLEFIFIDDSFYSGRTADTVIEHVKSFGGRYKGTFVIYDGSKEQRPDVYSLYRYHESK